MLKTLGFVLLITLSFISLISLGYFISDTGFFGLVEKIEIQYQCPRCSTINEIPSDNVNDGTNYLVDTVYIITKGKPDYVLIATIKRESDSTNTTTQTSRVSFYDGKNWSRDTVENQISDYTIEKDELINLWDLNIDKGISLKQDIRGSLSTNNYNITFESDEMTNEMPLRTTPDYTKFLSATEGTITIDGEIYPAYIAYAKIHSNNPEDMLIYDEDFLFKTYWMAFWDEDGNFYHADVTEVYDDIENYASHSIGYLKYTDGTLKKTFNMIVDQLDKNKISDKYQYKFGIPVIQEITIDSTSYFQKFPEVTYPWIFGYGSAKIINQNGEVKNARGVYEFIEND